MPAYFKSVYNDVVLKYSSGYDIKVMREHAEYEEVDKDAFDKYQTSVKRSQLEQEIARKKALEKEIRQAQAELDRLEKETAVT